MMNIVLLTHNVFSMPHLLYTAADLICINVEHLFLRKPISHHFFQSSKHLSFYPETKRRVQFKLVFPRISLEKIMLVAHTFQVWNTAIHNKFIQYFYLPIPLQMLQNPYNRGLLLFSFWKRAESDCLYTRLKGG